MPESNWTHDGALRQSVGALPFLFETPEFAEWLHWFSSDLEECGDLRRSGLRRDASTLPFFLLNFSLAGRPIDSAHVSGFEQEGETLLFACLHQPATKGLVEQIVHSAVVGLEKMGKKEAVHAWSALIAEDPTQTEGAEIRLVEPFHVGNMDLRATGTSFAEPVPSRFSFSAYSPRKIHPILVTGASAGFNWEKAELAAARDLWTLRALLAVSWELPLAVRESARPTSWQAGDLGNPERAPYYEPEPDDDAGRRLSSQVKAPQWLESGWKVVREQPVISRALDVFLEGEMLLFEHPSMSSVAFTSCIEGVSKSVFRLGHCSECRSVRGVGKAFKQTAALVLDDEANVLLGPLYSRRSKTVHEGILHGREVFDQSFSFWHLGKETNFELQSARLLRHTARELLKLAFQRRLPERRSLEWA